jgi:GntR family transcriptional regulator, rspAB operon transcriptional repressor
VDKAHPALAHVILPPSNLNRLTPLREQVYQLLRNAIVNGRMKPGESVDEHDIARQLGISRTPVREAVKKLSDEGLIDVVAQSGTRIAPIDRQQVKEAYIIRTALELESVARAAAIITRDQIQDLQDIVDRTTRAFDRRAFDELVSLDDEFHRYIAEVSKLTMLWRAIDISKAQTDRCAYLSTTTPSTATLTISQHKAIVRALNTRRQDTAVKAMRVHLDSSLAKAVSVLDKGVDAWDANALRRSGRR